MKREPKITARKFEGDDRYSWAVFIDGKPAFTGLARSQVPYYKEKAKEGLMDAAVKALYYN
jgi:hypothetical protein